MTELEKLELLGKEIEANTRGIMQYGSSYQVQPLRSLDISTSAPSYDSFGIMANTPGPTPDGLLIQDFIDKNNW